MRRMRIKLETRLHDVVTRRRQSHPSGRLDRDSVRDVVSSLNEAERRIVEQMASDADHLLHSEDATRSQNGEDGIIAEIFRRIGTTTSTFVEIGAADGVENCTGALVDSGWGGVWVEGDPEKAEAARRLLRGSQGDSEPDAAEVVVLDSFVDRDSVVDLLSSAGVARDFDLLVVDIDGNDAWVLERICEVHRPRVIVVEYNAALGTSRRWVMPYDADHHWDETSRHGASLAALDDIAASFGYDLVGCDSLGVNAFFVQGSESEHFTIRSVEGTWVPPRFNLPFGHPRASIIVPELERLSEHEAGGLEVSVCDEPPANASAGAAVYFGAAIINRSSVRVGEAPTHATRVAAQWIAPDGRRIPEEPVRSVQPWWVDHSETVHLVGRIDAPNVPGQYDLEVVLVQEDVRWMRETPNIALTRRVTISE